MEKSEEKIIPTFCHGCGAAKPKCGILCHVKNGRLIRVEGNPEAMNNWGRGSTALCAKAYTAAQFVYAPDRLKYPMKRIGEKGEGKFKRITWDEALDTIAAKLKETKEKYGPESYAVLSPEIWPVLATMGRRFLNIYGSPNYCHSAICATPRMAATKSTIGRAGTSPHDLDNAALIVNWGANCENSGVNSGQASAILNAVEKGTKLIDIRPMLDQMGAKANIWLPIRPGTDCALALSFLNVIVSENLYDFDFVSEWCYGFDKLVEHVRKFPPEWAEYITSLPADRIREVARMIGTMKPVVIRTGNGIGDQTNDGTSTVMAINLVVAITGNLSASGGPPGGMPGMDPDGLRINRVSTLDERAPEDMVRKLVAPETPLWYQTPDNWESGPTSAYYKAIMSVLTGKPYPIRVLNASCTNPLSATRNPKKVAEALKKLDFMFVMDIFHASHINYADIVLPASTGYEQSCQIGMKSSKEGTWLGIYNEVVEPIGESRSDWQFYLDLAVRMGYGADFWNGDMDACLREQLAPSGITLEELRNSPRGIFIEREPVVIRSNNTETSNGFAASFKNLPHGKVQCYNEYLGGKENCEGTGTLSYLPEYKGPPEGIAETPELAKEYPLILSDVHAHLLSHHSYLHDLAYIRELQPYPWVRINPATAQKYGISNGDWVRVESPYGWSKFVAEYFEGLSPEVLMTKRGWWQACEELGLPGYPEFDGGSEVNNLYNTNEELFDKFHSQMAKQTLVKISRIEGHNERTV